MLRRKILIVCCILVFILVGGFSLSYSTSKRRAETIALGSKAPISPLEGQLVLFIGDDFIPCWVFRGEYKYAITGATFDVYVSIFGRVFKKPTTELKEDIIIKKGDGLK